MHTSRRAFLKCLGMGITALSAPSLLSCRKPSLKKPNIVLIMADDMGFSDIGCYGGEINTPHINGLAENGVRFTQFYNNGICVPTRASLLNGLYSQQVGVYQNSPVRYENSVTLAEVLKSAGYRTLMAGKWHAEEIPVKRGFDRHFGLCDGCCNYFNPGPRRPGEPEPGRKGTPGSYPRRWAVEDQEYKPYAPPNPDFYTTDAFTDYALGCLDEYGQEDRPFFLYIAYTSPHYPLHAWPEDIAKYRGKYMIGWDEIRSRRFVRQKEMGLFPEHMEMTPRDEEIPGWDDVEDKDAWDLRMSVYAAMIDRMDQNIGRILAKIRDLGKEEDTLVIFLSDNGGCAETHLSTPGIPPGPVESYRTVDPPWANASNTPFRKYKAWDYEGGICTPFIARWPSVIQKKGGFNSTTGHLIDIMTTLVEISGADYPGEYGGRKILPMEGTSLVPAFRGKETGRVKPIFWQTNRRRNKAVRDGKWKLVSRSPDDPWELYDLEKDRFETTNLSDQYPARVETMAKLWQEWADRVGI